MARSSRCRSTCWVRSKTWAATGSSTRSRSTSLMTDLKKARKLIKQIGLEPQKDPEFVPLIIEPMKIQGVDELGDYAVTIRAKMMTVPGEQFVTRRKAYAMIKKAFDENGIKFACPTVQVAGESEAAGAGIAVAQRALELTQCCSGVTASKPPHGQASLASCWRRAALAIAIALPSLVSQLRASERRYWIRMSAIGSAP